MQNTSDIRNDNAFYTTDSTAILPSCGICFKSVIGGAIAAAAVSVILAAFGSGLGLAFMSPYTGDETTIAGFTAKMAIWLIIMQWLSSALGGYLTGRLRRKWTGIHDDEIFFRDTAHGLLSWALATFLVVALVAGTAASVASGTVKAGTAVASAAAAGAAANAKDGNVPAFDPVAYAVDTLYRVEGNADASANIADTRAESSRILLKGLGDGEFTPADKDYLATIVASRTGISQADAGARVDNAVSELVAGKQKALETADKARKAASAFSIFTALSMLLGAFIASVSAVIGGCHRDGQTICCKKGKSCAV